MKARNLAILLVILSALALFAASSARADFTTDTLEAGNNDLTGNSYLSNYGSVIVGWLGAAASSTATIIFSGFTNVPDGASTAILLGIASLGVWLLKRFFTK